MLRKNVINDTISEFSAPGFEKLGPNHPLMVNREDSVISDFDAPKDNMIDNISLHSNGLGILVEKKIGMIKEDGEFEHPLKLDTLSQVSKSDLPDLKSIDVLIGDNKL